METFLEKYRKASDEKGSIININLDPALPWHRSSHTIPKNFLSESDSETILNFSLDLIEKVSDLCCSIKPNTQYFLNDTKILAKISKAAKNHGLLAILDHKLSDIGSTNEAAISWISKMGFDAFTFSPFAGNTAQTTSYAHRKGLGVIVLTVMSNPEAEKTILSKLDGEEYYLRIAKEVKTTGADGCVVGITNFVKAEHISNVQRLAGNDKVFLLQGLGPQGGEIEKIKPAENPLVSLGRDVIFSDDVKSRLKNYNEMLGKAGTA
ncbi:MAG: orotidine 5'-phosphate decarboxylase [Candidatus Aenigmarchaeota archaeon]|nr:orotidine 5'-phosphate decarboxylase [Candidatus Aenigmarchaeota archaeon]